MPTELGLLANLTDVLDLHRNSLSTTVPTELGQLVRLASSFVISSNQLYPLGSTLPTQLGKLERVEQWSLEDRTRASRKWDTLHIWDDIPTELGMATRATDLRLWNNELKGSVPTELGRLSELRMDEAGSRGFLASNFLGWTLPSELGNMVKAYSLPLYSNFFMSTLPSQLGRLSEAVYVNLRDNFMTGGLPTQLGGMRNVRASVKLPENLLSGSLPTQLGHMTKVRDTAVSWPCADGHAPMATRRWLCAARTASLLATGLPLPQRVACRR